MRFTRQIVLASVALACFFILGAQTTAFAQGRGRGGGGSGRPAGVGNPGMGGRPSGSPGVERGLGTASERSGGRSDRGLGRASERSDGRSDDGLNRARARSENGRRTDEELRRNPGIANGLNTNQSELRNRYEAALVTNPNLKFGQFVAANMLARNLGRRNSNITTDAILQGLASGKSIGRTLQDLGLSSREAREAERNANREMRARRRRR